MGERRRRNLVEFRRYFRRKDTEVAVAAIRYRTFEKCYGISKVYNTPLLPLPLPPISCPFFPYFLPPKSPNSRLRVLWNVYRNHHFDRWVVVRVSLPKLVETSGTTLGGFLHTATSVFSLRSKRLGFRSVYLPQTG